MPAGFDYRSSSSGTSTAAVEVVAASTLSVAAASIDFTGIPATYKHLRLVLVGRSDQATSLTTLRIRFNNDSGANYFWQSLKGFATNVQAADSTGQTSGQVGDFPAASASANIPGALTLEIPNYAGTVFEKAAFGVYVGRSSASSSNQYLTEVGFAWGSTAAISRITAFPAAGNFIAGTVATLYGLKDS